MRNWFLRAILMVLCLSSPCLLTAQDSAALNGVVTDTTGAVLPGVTVTLTNKSVGTKFVQKTDSHGEYRFLNVPPSPSYELVFTLPGFSTFDIKSVPVTVGNTRTQDAKLAAGQSVSVEVTAANAEVTINTTDSSIGNNIDVRTLNDLPIQDRVGGISSLFYLQPGVDSNQGAVSGARIDQSSVTVDGMDANDIAAGTTFAIVAQAPADAVEEFKGTVAGLTPALGTGSGGQFQLVTKSGKNRFYGNVNEYHRDTTTSANQYFNNLVGLPRTPLIQNQFGGNVGGPIRIPHVYNGTDKLFFFFNFVDSRIIKSSQGVDTVPLSNLYNNQLNYINSGANCGDASRLNTTPQCISTLNANQVAALDPTGVGFNPTVISFLKGRFPAANDLTLGDGVNTGGYRFNVATPVFNTNYIARIDYNLNEKMKIFGRFTINRQNSIESLPVLPTDPVTHPFIDRSYSYVVSHVWQIGSNKVNQVYYGDTISKYDFPNAYNPTGIDAYSFSGLSSPYSGTDGQKRRVPIPEIRDDFNWQVKSHTITFGGTFKFIKTNSDLTNNFNFVGVGLGGGTSNGLDNTVRPCHDLAHPDTCGSVATDINQGGTGVALNDYDNLFTSSLGTIGSISSNYDYTNAGTATPQGSGGPRAYRYFQTELYVGDTWKINPKLTISYGLRYQLYSVPYEAHGNESVETYGTNSVQNSTYDGYVKARLAQSAAGNTSASGLPLYSVILGGKANKGPNLYAPQYKDFAPRVALAFNPYPKTVFNVGAGIVYDRTVINAINFLQDQISYLFSNTQTAQFGGSSPGASLAVQPRIQPGNFHSLTGQTIPGFTYDHTLIAPPLALTVPYTPYVSGDTLYGLGAGETNFVISPNLKDPYSIALNAGVQQEFPGHLLLKANYVGRMGRRLLADADAGQVLDFPDTTSGQLLSQAFAQTTMQLRSGATVTAQPWFENVLAPGTGAAFGYGNNTNLVTALAGTYIKRGDISDALYLLGYYTAFGGLNGFLPNNVGIPSQFGSNAYLTNQGNSNYHALLVTVDKNLSSGLKAEFNYTWEHSIDNTSLSANGNALFINAGFICDITKPRACRGSSDFDVRQEISSYFIYHLPIGRGKTYAANTSRLLDEAIGGWTISGIPKYRTGVAITPYSDAYLASFDNDDPAIFTGNKGDLKSKVNQSNGTVYNFAGGAAGAAKVAAEFRGPIGLEYGQRNLVNSTGAFLLDAGLEKLFPILDDDRLNLTFRADAFNVLNHPVFLPPGLNIVTQASPFGQLTATPTNNQPGAARVGQFSLRLEF
jgi:hypothetical protein